MEEAGDLIGEKLAPYNPTNLDAIDISIGLLKIQSNDIVYDLGCGDARFLVQSCKKINGIRGVGIEYDRKVFEKALENVRANDLTERIRIIHDNVLNIDIAEATVIFVYLVPEGLRKMKEKLIDAVNRGVRIISYVFSIPELEPQETIIYKSSTKLYLYSS